jgi:hypothetical protein
MEDAPRERRPDRLSWAVFALLAVVYRWGRCPTFGPGDSPGVVYRALNAPGHDPLAWLGHLAAALPFDAPMAQVDALSGLFHAGAAALLFAALRRWGIKRLPALGAAALVAFTNQYWYYALVAGRAPVATFGLALAVWGGVAWKEEARAWPLAFCALGVAFLALYAPRAVTQAPLLIWSVGLLCGLLFQRLDLLRPKTAAGILTGILLIALMNPYDARRHNPMMEYARAVVEGVEPDAVIYTNDQSVNDALRLIAPPSIRIATLGDSHPIYRHEYYEVVMVDHLKGWYPKGLLSQILDLVPVHQDEMDRRAEAVLALPALTSVGRRDMGKYGFTRESILYERYRVVLKRYRELVSRDDLRQRLDAQIADYSRP